MTGAEQLRQSIQQLLAERDILKRRNREIARKLHLLRVKLSRLPDDGDTSAHTETTPQGNLLDDFDTFFNSL